MNWVFILFTVGTIIYTIAIVKDYLLDARIQNTLYGTLATERELLENRIRVQKEEEEAIKAQIQNLRKDMQEVQEIVDKRQAEVRRIEAEMANRGKYRL